MFAFLNSSLVAAMIVAATASLPLDDDACVTPAGDSNRHRSMILRRVVREAPTGPNSLAMSEKTGGDDLQSAFKAAMSEKAGADDLQSAFKDFDNFLQTGGFPAHDIEGHLRSDSNTSDEQVSKYTAWANNLNASNICQTGFKAGHSTLHLLAQSKARLYEFDKCEQSFSKPAAEYLASKFPERFTLICGDLAATLPDFAKAYPEIKCDLLTINGDDSANVALLDLSNIAKIAAENALIAIDNTACQENKCAGPSEAWTKFVADGCVVDESHISISDARGFSFGTVKTCARLRGTGSTGQDQQSSEGEQKEEAKDNDEEETQAKEEEKTEEQMNEEKEKEEIEKKEKEEKEREEKEKEEKEREEKEKEEKERVEKEKEEQKKREMEEKEKKEREEKEAKEKEEAEKKEREAKEREEKEKEEKEKKEKEEKEKKEREEKEAKEKEEAEKKEREAKEREEKEREEKEKKEKEEKERAEKEKEQREKEKKEKEEKEKKEQEEERSKAYGINLNSESQKSNEAVNSLFDEMDSFLAAAGYPMKNMDEHVRFDQDFLDKQSSKYDEWANTLSLNSVCETGFGAGHSALRFLAQTQAKVYSFDLCQTNYTRPAADFLNARYPGRLTLACGNSNTTLPNFLKYYSSVKCDLILVDGDRSLDVAASDMTNLAKMATANAVIAMDDTPCKGHYWCDGPTEAWTRAVADGCIQDEVKVPMGDARGFSYGRVKPCAHFQDQAAPAAAAAAAPAAAPAPAAAAAAAAAAAPAPAPAPAPALAVSAMVG